MSFFQSSIFRRFRMGLPLVAFLGSASPVHAEYIKGLKTWVAANPVVGMVHYDATGPENRWAWSINGQLHVCNQTAVNEAAHTREFHCPDLNTRIHLTRWNMSLTGSNGSTSTYPGSWDDRRFWYYRYGNILGRFYIKDHFQWEENKFQNDSLIETNHLKETRRDNDYVYLFDAARNIYFAIGATKAHIKRGDGPWTEALTGLW